MLTQIKTSPHNVDERQTTTHPQSRLIDLTGVAKANDAAAGQFMALKGIVGKEFVV